jgi:hypothetical protein
VRVRAEPAFWWLAERPAKPAARCHSGAEFPADFLGRFDSIPFVIFFSAVLFSPHGGFSES